MLLSFLHDIYLSVCFACPVNFIDRSSAQAKLHVVPSSVSISPFLCACGRVHFISVDAMSDIDELESPVTRDKICSGIFSNYSVVSSNAVFLFRRNL